jgi:cystathionine beta-lyase family protein involved in aluminum resistance
MNKFPKCNKQADEAEQYILKAFNKINEITHGDNRNVMKKYKKKNVSYY